MFCINSLSYRIEFKKPGDLESLYNKATFYNNRNLHLESQWASVIAFQISSVEMLNILQLLSLMASANITSTKPDVVSLIPLHNMLHVTICLILRVSVMLRQDFMITLSYQMFL